MTSTRVPLAALAGACFLSLPALPAVSASSSGIPAVAATTADDRMAGRVAAGWLGRQMADGSHFETVFDGVAYPDAGLTLDAVLAFAAAKVNDVRAERALDWLARPSQLAGYLGDGSTESYAGAHAKLVLSLEVRGVDPRSYGGRNILQELTALQRPSGRFADASVFGDYSNAFSQSLGVLATVRAGSPASRRAATYLGGQGCADGGIPIVLDQSTCTADVDATALAAQALRAGGRTTEARRALTWLTTYAKRNGGFGNANSAGLAAAAFESAGRPVPAAAARRTIRGLQQGCSTPFRQRGAVTFVPGPYVADSAPRATAQAALGFAGADLARLASSRSIDWAPTLAC